MNLNLFTMYINKQKWKEFQKTMFPFFFSLKLTKLAYCQTFCLAVVQVFEWNTKSGMLCVLQ